MSILARPLVYDDLLHTPDDNKRYEIIGGELYVAASPVVDHQRLTSLLHVDFFMHVEPQGLGRVFPAPIDVVLGMHDVVVPDIVFVAANQLHIIGEKYIDGAPDLVLEILSPTMRKRDETIKTELYARSEVPEYWVVDPIARQIRVFTLRDGAYVDTSTGDGFARSIVLPGFAVDVAALFAKL